MFQVTSFIKFSPPGYLTRVGEKVLKNHSKNRNYTSMIKLRKTNTTLPSMITY